MTGPKISPVQFSQTSFVPAPQRRAICAALARALAKGEAE